VVVYKQCVHGSPINGAIYEFATRAGNCRRTIRDELDAFREERTHRAGARCCLMDGPPGAPPAPHLTAETVYHQRRRSDDWH